MPWLLTEDAEAYAARAGRLLEAHAVECTVALSALDAVRRGFAPPGEPAVFAWYEDAAGVRGAALLAPPHELLLAVVPDGTEAGLAVALQAAAVAVPGASGAAQATERFVRAWTSEGGAPVRGMRLLLHDLATLVPPEPPPPGAARAATLAEAERVTAWAQAFDREVGIGGGDVRPFVRERVGGGRLWLWEEAPGMPVAMAARTAPVGGVSRITHVYTPPEHRRRGFGAAVTAVCAGHALDAGAAQVVLFTDAANPTSNRVYRRIGFRPVGEHRIVRFDGP